MLICSFNYQTQSILYLIIVLHARSSRIFRPDYRRTNSHNQCQFKFEIIILISRCVIAMRESIAAVRLQCKIL